MKVIKHIMFDEFRYWWRTRLAATVIAIGVLLTIASVIVNSLQMQQATEEREQLQRASEARFLEQPNRHPHRMVHYGHYVFRAPAPLSIIEPGVDAFAGTSIFLEGHRQNSAMFADQKQSSGLTRFSSLSPTFLLQVLVPLLLLLVGYASVTREREAGTLDMLLTQGMNQKQILLGKFFALVITGFIILLPLIFASLFAIGQGESWVVVLGFVTGYLFYVFIWGALVLFISAMSLRSSSSLILLIAAWILFCILIPRISSSSATALSPSPGKLETDFAVLEELRKLGDGHNASDPAFAQLKANLLAQYNVDDVSQLPINFRGVVAEYSEKKLTDVMVDFAENHMQEELTQAKIARYFGWLSPTVAMRTFSMVMAGTPLETHHRFLREAEALRFEFVQSLNHLHTHDLDYNLDINRYRDTETGWAARVDANNWSLLSKFDFKTEPGFDRLKQSVIYALQLLFWCVLTIFLINLASRRLAQ
jgi:ABC-2 type transport system permease protein